MWVLTGDKVDTAKNIGFACKLLTKDMEILEYSKEAGTANQSTQQLIERQKSAKQGGQKTGLLVTGDIIEGVMSKENNDHYDSVDIQLI